MSFSHFGYTFRPRRNGVYDAESRIDVGQRTFSGFQYIYPAEESRGDFTKADVICVPAVGADPYITWRREKVFGANSARPLRGWLKDLRDKVPEARILLYDHGKPKNGDGLETLARHLLDHVLKDRLKRSRQDKPLLFICHSTGGLVVKQALIYAADEEEYEDVIRFCSNISFFAVPHGGSQVLSECSDETLKSKLGYQHSLSRKLKSQLKTNSGFLRSMAIAFASIADRFEISSFCESQKINVIPAGSTNATFTKSEAILVVTPESTRIIIGDQNELSYNASIITIKSEVASSIDSIALNCNHSSTAIFESKTSLERADHVLRLQRHIRGKIRSQITLLEEIKVEIHQFLYGRKKKSAHSVVMPTLDDFLWKGSSVCLQEYEKNNADYETKSSFVYVEPRQHTENATEIISADTEGPKNRTKFPKSTAKSTVGFDERPILSTPNNKKPEHSTMKPEKSIFVPEEKSKYGKAVTDDTNAATLKENRGQEQDHSGAPNSLPDDGESKKVGIESGFRWIHVPCTHIEWAKMVLERVSKDRHNDNLYGNLTNYAHWGSKQNIARHQSPHARYLHSTCAFVDAPVNDTVVNTNQEARSAESRLRKIQMALYLPYLYWDTFDNSKLRARTIKTRLDFERQRRRKEKLSQAQKVLDEKKLECEHVKEKMINQEASKHVEFKKRRTAQQHIEQGFFKRYRDFQKNFAEPEQLHLTGIGEGLVKELSKQQDLDMKISRQKSSTQEYPSVREYLGSGSVRSRELPLNYIRDLENEIREQQAVLKGEERILKDEQRILEEQDSQLQRQIATDTEFRLITEELTSENTWLHCRRTLDQFGYPTLHDTSLRDQDQILYKRTRLEHGPKGLTSTSATVPYTRDFTRSLNPFNSHNSGGVGSNSGNVIMVDQLWLWVLDDETLVTFSSSKTMDVDHDGVLKEVDLRRDMGDDLGESLENMCDDAWDFAALLVKHVITVLLNKMEHTSLQIFRLFQELIHELNEKHNESWTSFRKQLRHGKSLDKEAEAISVELEAMVELHDIDDELHMMDRVLQKQEKHIKIMKQYYQDDLNSRGKKGIMYLIGVLDTIKDNRSHISNLVENARHSRNAFKELLDFKQQQTSINEAKNAAQQSRAITIFTVFAIFFLPLSFFASLFGMNAREWSGQEQNVSLKEIFQLAIPISFVVIVFSLLLALNPRFGELTRKLYDMISEHIFKFTTLIVNPKTGKSST